MNYCNRTMHHRYWAVMTTMHRARRMPTVREIGPADTEEGLDLLIANEWRRAEEAGHMVCDVHERAEEA